MIWFGQASVVNVRVLVNTKGLIFAQFQDADVTLKGRIVVRAINENAIRIDFKLDLFALVVIILIVIGCKN